MTGNVHDNCYLHIHLLPTHLQLASADFICLLLVATFADPHICLLPIAILPNPNPNLQMEDKTTKSLFFVHRDGK